MEFVLPHKPMSLLLFTLFVACFAAGLGGKYIQKGNSTSAANSWSLSSEIRDVPWSLKWGRCSFQGCSEAQRKMWGIITEDGKFRTTGRVNNRYFKCDGFVHKNSCQRKWYKVANGCTATRICGGNKWKRFGILGRYCLREKNEKGPNVNCKKL